MVFKFNQNKFNKFSDTIYKISKKNKLENQHKKYILMATIIASFSQTHSWKTSKAIENGFIAINDKDIKDEFSAAKSNKWKNISANDVKEIANKNICNNVFSRWLEAYVEPEKKKEYNEAWSILKNEIFEKTCD